MKTTANGIIVLTALMWIATPLVLGYGFSWDFVSSWFYDFDYSNPATYALIVGRAYIVLTAVHIVLCAVRVFLDHTQTTAWRKTRITFNILFALLWLLIGIGTILLTSSLFLKGPHGSRQLDLSLSILGVPCLTPLATGVFYVAKTIMELTSRRST